MTNCEALLAGIVRSLDKHKAQDLKVLRVTALTSIADYFVLATGTSSTNVRSLADYVEDEMEKEGETPLRRERASNADWISLDYGEVLVHIFRPETREFYGLEHLWADAESVDITPYQFCDSN